MKGGFILEIILLKRAAVVLSSVLSFITGPAVGLETIITTKLCLVAYLQHHTLINSWLIIKTPPKVMVTFPVSGPTVKSSSCCALRLWNGNSAALIDCCPWAILPRSMRHSGQRSRHGSAAFSCILLRIPHRWWWSLSTCEEHALLTNRTVFKPYACFSSRQRSSLDDGADLFEPERPSMNAL